MYVKPQKNLVNVAKPTICAEPVDAPNTTEETIINKP